MNLKLIILGLVALLLGACAGTPKSPVGTPDAMVTSLDKSLMVSDAQKELKRGNIAEAANIYRELAGTADSPKRQLWKMQSAELYMKINQFNLASELMADVDITPLTPVQRNIYFSLQTELALSARDADRALSWLQSFQLESDTPISQRIGYHQKLVRSYELKGSAVAAVRERVNLDTLLETGDEKTLNQQKIIQTLIMMPQQSLVSLREEDPSPVFKGWLDLALLSLKTPDPSRLANALSNWKRNNPSHPVNDATLTILAPRAETDNLPPSLNQIALLLPLEGSFKQAAQAVRDGFISAYYNQPELRHTSQIRVYNTGGANANIVEIYRQAIDDGATIVIGPLKKESVDALVAYGKFAVPTLALNTVEQAGFFHENLYQFGLSPEDEARQVAERAWADGHNFAAAIYPQGSWGERVFQSFASRWQELGGQLVAAQTYDAKKNDFSDAITEMLDLDDSKARNSNLRKLLGEKLAFEPRRRQDIDVIFMAAFPRQARLIPPQLKFHHAGDVPIYSTSHSFTGKTNRNDDRDLNNVTFADMPWTLPGGNRSELYGALSKAWPNELAQQTRLYALGVDSFNILYYLNWLRTNPNATLNAATGTLSVNNINQVRRNLSWAKFRGGAPRLLSDSAILHP